MALALAFLGGGIATRVASAPRASNTGALSSGPEIAVVFLVSSNCGASKTPGFASAFESLRDSVTARAQREGARTRMIGVAVDPTVGDGLDVLEQFGHFDEITLGGGWLNVASQKYMWGRFAGKAGVPQVLILQRRLHIQGSDFRVAEETFVIRKVGTDELLAWAHAGFPWPQ